MDYKTIYSHLQKLADVENIDVKTLAFTGLHFKKIMEPQQLDEDELAIIKHNNL